jgi:predicted transcriptional regulator
VPAAYTYSQVDRLLGLTSGTARRWINGYGVFPILLTPI